MDIPPLIALCTLADSTPGSFLERIEIWPVAKTLMRMVLAVAAGTFVGLEREHRGKAGVRTFALTSLLDCLGGLLDGAYGPIRGRTREVEDSPNLPSKRPSWRAA